MENLRSKKSFGILTGLSMVAMLGCASILALPGCQTAPYDQADTQVAGAKGVKASLLDGQKQVEATNKALSDLTDASKNKDARTMFNTYSAQIIKVEEAGKNIATSNTNLKTASANFFTARSSQINSIANPDVRNTADTRLKDAKAKFQTLSAQVDAIQAEYQPMVTQFNDLKTLLGNDLSKSGLAAAADVTKRSYEQANALRQKTTEVVTAIDKFMAEVVPESAGAAAAPAK